MDINDLNYELQTNFIEYAVAVNTDRAIPDATCGLKPVARRILWDCHVNSYTSNKEHVKCARIVSSTMGVWHCHGDSSIYGALVHISLPWVMRYPLIDFHGNMGSISGDGPAAYRYTNARLAKIAEDGLLCNIDKRNVDFVPNYDENDEEPITLPALFPNLLCNPNLGIGVATSSHWLTNNLGEVAGAIFQYMDGKEPTLPGPDFPTGGLIINGNELPAIIKRGSGSIKVRGKYTIEKNKIVFYEVPYESTLEDLIKQIGELAEKEIDEVEDVHDESNKKGLRIVIECRKGANLNQVIAKIFAKTDMQKSLSLNQIALVNKTPTLLGLKDCIKIYVEHNVACLIKEIDFDKKKAAARLEIINGLLKALEDIDNIINLIKNADSAKDARMRLIDKYQFTENQAKAIVDMKLGSLAGLEKIELQKEKAKLDESIKNYDNILESREKQEEVIRERLAALVKKYGDKRRTEITTLSIDKEVVPDISSEDAIVTLMNDGTIKRTISSSFRTQRRGGKGKAIEGGNIKAIVPAKTDEYLILFTDAGKVYKSLVHNIPEIATHNLLQLAANEKIIAISPYAQNKYIAFITRLGLFKKSSMEEYSSLKRNSGVTAMRLSEQDDIVSAAFLGDNDVMMMVTRRGYAIMFETKSIKAIGRNTMGVKGINLLEGDEVIAAFPIKDFKNSYIGVFLKNGFGKIIKVEDFTIQARAGRGVQILKSDSSLIDILLLNKNDSVLLTGDSSSIKIDAASLPVLGRYSEGCKLIDTNRLIAVTKI